MRAGFDECENLVRRFNAGNRYWVTPFGFGSEHYLQQLMAAATIVEGGTFRGPSQSPWVNPGQSTCLKITKALSVRTEASEVEEEGGREAVWVGGNDYRRTKVKGTLKVQNSRSSPITMVITTEFSGELIEAEGAPEKSLRTEGVSNINPRRKLETAVKLAAGEEKTLTYRYSVLGDQ